MPLPPEYFCSLFLVGHVHRSRSLLQCSTERVAVAEGGVGSKYRWHFRARDPAVAMWRKLRWNPGGVAAPPGESNAIDTEPLSAEDRRGLGQVEQHTSDTVHICMIYSEQENCCAPQDRSGCGPSDSFLVRAMREKRFMSQQQAPL